MYFARAWHPKPQGINKYFFTLDAAEKFLVNNHGGEISNIKNWEWIRSVSRDGTVKLSFADWLMEKYPDVENYDIEAYTKICKDYDKNEWHRKSHFTRVVEFHE